jgi:uncharacterized glyoxalase superfamily protein PhnB
MEKPPSSAEVAYRRADERGDPGGASNLGMLLAERGDLEGTEAAVDGFYKRAVTAGAEVLKTPTDEPWGMREMALRSPDGHRFTLGHPIRPV